MSKISELSDGGSLVSSDYLIAVRSGGNVKVRMDSINVDQVDLGDNEFIRLGNSQDLTMVHTSTQSIINQAGIGDLLLQKAGTTKASITANGLEFPDNSKAIFGAGSDLQIYSDGTQSYISDQGAGSLFIRSGSNIYVQNAGGTANYFKGTDGGAAELFHNGSSKLATTATGIDVTGSVTADGLTVNGEGSIIALSDNAVFNVNVSGGTSKTSTINQRAKSSNGSNADTSIVVTGSGGEAVSAWDFKLDTANGALTKAMTIDGNGNLSLYEDTGTTPKFYWDASEESLGIGTSSPSALLHSFVGASAVTGIYANNSNSGASTGILIHAHSSRGDTSAYTLFKASNSTGTKMIVQGDGFVGIGTDLPDAALHVVSSTVAEFRVGNIGPSNNSAIRVSRNDTTVTTGNPLGYLEFGGNDSTSNLDTAFAYVGAEASGTHAAGNNPTELVFGTTDNNAGAPVKRMTIDSSGRVGIGTDSPSEELTIRSSVPKIQIEDSDGTNQYGQFYHSAGITAILARNDTADGTIVFQKYDGTTTDETMRIDASGLVGIGTSSPSVAMHSVGKVRAQKSGQSNAYVQLSADELTSNYAADIFLNDTGLTFKHNSGSRGFVFDQNGSERMRIDASGNLLVGTTVSGGVGATIYNPAGVGRIDLNKSFSGAATAMGFYYNGGQVGSITYTDTSTSFNTSSDQRLKENIADAPSASDDIDAIQVRSFDWKADGEHQKYGMIAQELQTVAPEAVSGNADSEEMMGVDYSKLVPMMLKEIQSLRARVAQLES